jgi:hypothetical protein
MGFKIIYKDLFFTYLSRLKEMGHNDCIEYSGEGSNQGLRACIARAAMLLDDVREISRGKALESRMGLPASSRNERRLVRMSAQVRGAVRTRTLCPR